MYDTNVTTHCNIFSKHHKLVIYLISKQRNELIVYGTEKMNKLDSRLSHEVMCNDLPKMMRQMLK